MGEETSTSETKGIDWSQYMGSFDAEGFMWFGVSYVLEVLIAGKHNRYEENVFLMKLDQPEMAETKAREIIAKSEQTYKNEFGETVEWRLKEILLVYPIIDDPEQFDGMEILSRNIDEEGIAALKRKFDHGD